jgi:predicted permease
MQGIVTTVLPVFGLIILGYVLAKARIIPDMAGRGITLFVFNVGIPAFLFRTVATMAAQDAPPWPLWFAFFGGVAVTWLFAAVTARVIQPLDYSGGASAAMASAFGNLALLGTPLALSHFGAAVAAPAGLILSVHAPSLWFAATLHRELSRHSDGFSFASIGREMALMMVRNAIILALLAAGVWRVTGFGLPFVADRMLQMLADASVPTALVALGVSLAGYSIRGAWSGVAALIVFKMIVMPAAVFVLATYVVTLPALWIKVAVLFAAMPTGANAFLFAQRNDEAVPAVSAAIALGTGLAAVSASVLLWLMD